MPKPTEITGETCPMCHKKTLALMEEEIEIPYFGKVFAFSMSCSNCKYHKADIEAAEKHEPAKYSLEVNGEEDLKIRVVKGSEAVVKIPHITTITPGPASNGYITNVEGILSRVKKEIQTLRESAEDDDDRKKAKKMLKKIDRILWGKDKMKLIIEDKTGNSAIISEKAVKAKL